LTGRKKDRREEIQREWSGSETAGGQHAVDMGMMLQSLVPGMQHAEETDLRTEVTRIAGDLQQGLSTGVKE
jgi:hypothetical protein